MTTLNIVLLVHSLNVPVYTTKGTIDGAEQGAALLRKMEEMYTAGEINFKPGAF